MSFIKIPQSKDVPRYDIMCFLISVKTIAGICGNENVPSVIIDMPYSLRHPSPALLYILLNNSCAKTVVIKLRVFDFNVLLSYYDERLSDQFNSKVHFRHILAF